MEWYKDKRHPNKPKFKIPEIPQETPDFKEFNKKGNFRKHMKDRACQSAENLFNLLPGSTFDVMVPKYGNKKNLPINYYAKLSLSMKLGVSNFGYKDRWTAE
jgi:hypothetical protein